MACPFFLPMEKLADGAWLHPGRLPLGCGWSGQCTAPGHEGESPSHEELRDFCNLGYAEGCGRLPQERLWDSVRFAARTVSDGDCDRASIQVRYVCERAHRPAEHGTLGFYPAEVRWERKHSDDRVQRMAECFLESYLEKRKKPDLIQAARNEDHAEERRRHPEDPAHFSRARDLPHHNADAPRSLAPPEERLRSG